MNNQTHAYNDMHGSVSAIGADGTIRKEYAAGGYPIDIVAANPAGGPSKLFVSNERDGAISVVDLATAVTTTVQTGANPVSLTLNKAQTKLFVSNSCGDTVSIVDTATNRVVQTIFLRIGDLKGLPGATPLGSALSVDEKTLFVAMADAIAVAVVDLD